MKQHRPNQTTENESSPVTVRANAGERYEAYRYPIALILTHEHIAVDIDGAVHLFSHDNLRYDGQAHGPLDVPATGEITVEFNGRTTAEGGGLRISAAELICISKDIEDWFFLADGLAYDGHGIAIAGN